VGLKNTYPTGGGGVSGKATKSSARGTEGVNWEGEQKKVSARHGKGICKRKDTIRDVVRVELGDEGSQPALPKFPFETEEENDVARRCSDGWKRNGVLGGRECYFARYALTRRELIEWRQKEDRFFGG